MRTAALLQQLAKDLIMAGLLHDNYIVIEKGRTNNQAFRVWHLQCKKTGKQLFACSRMHAGKTPLALEKNTKDQVFYPINNVNNFADATLAVENSKTSESDYEG